MTKLQSGESRSNGNWSGRAERTSQADILATDKIFHPTSSCNTQYIHRPRGDKKDRLRREYLIFPRRPQLVGTRRANCVARRIIVTPSIHTFTRIELFEPKCLQSLPRASPIARSVRAMVKEQEKAELVSVLQISLNSLAPECPRPS